MSINKLKGYSAGLVAEMTYGLNPLFALPLMHQGMNTSSILFFRYSLAIILLGAIIFVTKTSLRVSRAHLAMLAILGICFGLSSVTLFESYRYMGAGIASTLLFVYPLMVALIMRFMFGERLSAVTMTCLGVALVGIGLLFKGDGDTTLSLTGTLFVLASALSYALYMVFINRNGLNRLPVLTSTFYVLLFGMLVFIADIAFRGSLTVPLSMFQWGCALCLALLPTAISIFCTNKSINAIGATPTAILGAMEPLTALVVGVVVFGEVLTPRDFTGIFLIITAVVMVIGGSSTVRLLNRLTHSLIRKTRGCIIMAHLRRWLKIRLRSHT